MSNTTVSREHLIVFIRQKGIDITKDEIEKLESMSETCHIIDNKDGRFKCYNCGSLSAKPYFQYCPCCGIKFEQ